MSWNGNYFGENGAVADANAQFAKGLKTPHDQARLASVYYAAANRAMRDSVRGKVWFLPFWMWCVSRAMNLANSSFVGFPHTLTLDDLDVIASIWGRYGNPISISVRLNKRHLFGWAQNRLIYGEMCAPYTKAFLQIRYFKFIGHRPEEDEVFFIEKLAAETASVGDFNQASRVNRNLAKLLPRGDERRARLMKEAIALAVRGGSEDQLVKMGVKS